MRLYVDILFYVLCIQLDSETPSIPRVAAASRAASSSMMTEQDRSSSDKCDVRMDNAIFIDVLVPELHLYTLSRLTGLE